MMDETTNSSPGFGDASHFQALEKQSFSKTSQVRDHMDSSLHAGARHNTDCLFCKIVSGELKAHAVYDDEHAFAFLDLQPAAPGHTMVIPKVHALTLLDLGDEHVGPLLQAVKKVMTKIAVALQPDGFSVGFNHGRAGGQVVQHLHIHIIPRWLNDGGGAIQMLVRNPTREPLEQIAERIRTGTAAPMAHAPAERVRRALDEWDKL